jgi:hypothetical protein
LGTGLERAIIHVGIHKTGTTATQHYFEGRVEELIARGVRFVRMADMRNSITPMICDLTGWKQSELARRLRSYNEPAVIISDENIIGFPYDLLDGQLYPWATARLFALAELLDGIDVHVVLTLRDPAQFIAAFYCEYLRLGEFLSFDKYTAQFEVTGFSYLEVFGKFTNQVPRNVTVHVVPFEAELGGGVPVVTQNILKAALREEVSTPELDKTVRPSFTQEELELALDIGLRASPKLASAFLADIDRLGARIGATPFRPLPNVTADFLRARYIDELPRLGWNL